MNLKIDFSDPIIQKDDVLEITTKTLDSFYTSSKELDQLNLFSYCWLHSIITLIRTIT